jgi:hypothetical protein
MVEIINWEMKKYFVFVVLEFFCGRLKIYFIIADTVIIIRKSPTNSMDKGTYNKTTKVIN